MPVVLLVEDGADVRALFELTVRRMGARISLQVAENGGKAIRFLLGEGQYADRGKYPFPNLIVLDLKMPGVDGFEFLAWRRDTPFATIPLIVLEGTGSKSERSKSLDLEMGALHTFVKPVRLNDLYSLVREIMHLLPGVVLGRECEWS